MSGPFLELLREDLAACYGLPEAVQVRLLKYSENMTYLVHLPDGGKAVLRICRPGYHTQEELEGEVAWLRQLQAEKTVRTAAVFSGKSRSGVNCLSPACSAASPFAALAAAEGETSLRCVLFEFLEGETLQGLQGEPLYAAMAQMGALAARLHSQASGWGGAKHIKRFSWDFDDMVGSHARWGSCTGKTDLPAAWQSCYAAAIKTAGARLERYGRGPDRYGLIHSDLNINNVLVHDGQVALLDFDDCGFGWFLFDLSSALSEYFGEELRACRAALLRGYAAYRRLLPEDLAELDTFIVLRKIMRIGWIASHSDNDTVKSVPEGFYENTMRLAQAYMDGLGLVSA